jgi:hypothetical protein
MRFETFQALAFRQKFSKDRGYLPTLIFSWEESKRSTVLRNVDELPNCTGSHPRG